MSHPVRGAWIEIVYFNPLWIVPAPSHPVRGAWIEISVIDTPLPAFLVASRKGCVD